MCVHLATLGEEVLHSPPPRRANVLVGGVVNVGDVQRRRKVKRPDAMGEDVELGSGS